MKILTEKSIPNYYVLSLIIMYILVGFTWGMNFQLYLQHSKGIACGENGNWAIFGFQEKWEDGEPIYIERKYVL